MTNILDLDVVSYATAVGHAAAARLAQLLGPDFDPNFWYCDPGFGHTINGEDMVAGLGGYVADRARHAGSVGAEQLFIKARELQAHRHPESGFHDLDLWVRVAYAAFAQVVEVCVRELDQAQDRARNEEELRRLASMQQAHVAQTPVEDTVMEQHGDIHDKVFAATAAPVAGDATGIGPTPVALPGDAVAEGEQSSSATPAPAKKSRR